MSRAIFAASAAPAPAAVSASVWGVVKITVKMRERNGVPAKVLLAEFTRLSATPSALSDNFVTINVASSSDATTNAALEGGAPLSKAYFPLLGESALSENQLAVLSADGMGDSFGTVRAMHYFYSAMPPSSYPELLGDAVLPAFQDWAVDTVVHTFNLT